MIYTRGPLYLLFRKFVLVKYILIAFIAVLLMGSGDAVAQVSYSKRADRIARRAEKREYRQYSKRHKKAERRKDNKAMKKEEKSEEKEDNERQRKIKHIYK